MQPALKPPPNNGTPQDEHLERFKDSELLCPPLIQVWPFYSWISGPSPSVVNEDGASEQGTYVMYHS